MLYNERNYREESVLAATQQIMIAARTAPKSRGVDLVEVCTVTGEEKQRLLKEYEESQKEEE